MKYYYQIWDQQYYNENLILHWSSVGNRINWGIRQNEKKYPFVKGKPKQILYKIILFITVDKI